MTVVAAPGVHASSEDLGDLTVAFVSENALVYMAIQEAELLGTWDDLGIDVEVVSANDASAAQLLATGDIDIVAQTAVRQVETIDKGVEASIIGGIRRGNAQFLFVTNASGAESIEDLKGATFGISGFGSPGHYSTVSAAEAQGWTEGDYEITALGGIAELQAAAEAGSIDAFWWTAPVTFTLQSRGIGTVLGPIGDYASDRGLISFAARNEVIDDRPEALRAFLDGYYDTIARFLEDPNIPREVMIDHWGQSEIAADAAIEAELHNTFLNDEIPESIFEDIRVMLEFFAPDVDVTLEDILAMYHPFGAGIPEDATPDSTADEAPATTAAA